jgi:hypothetical protein
MADVVATAPGFGSTDARREVWDVVAEVAVGTALLAGTDRVGVAYTPSGGHTTTRSFAGMTLSGVPDGGASLGLLRCSVDTDGSWEFAVTGVTGATKNGTIVYAVVSSGQITSLTTTAGSNVRFGTVNNPEGYTPSASKCVVKVGA